MKLILTGATGMVGEGVLLECLENAAVQTVLSVSRRSCNRTHAKLRELLVADFRDLSAVEGALRLRLRFCACRSPLAEPDIGRVLV